MAIRFAPRPTVDDNKSFSFRVRVDDGLPLSTTLTNTAVLSSSGVTYTLRAVAIANTMYLAGSTKAVDRPLAMYGDTLVYTLTVRNGGTAAGAAWVTDALPLALAYVPGSASNGAAYDSATRSVLWNGRVAPGAPAQITFAATVDPSIADRTAITNTARFADALGQAYDRSAATLYRVGDLALSQKEVTPAAVLHYGDVATFTIRIANGGGGSAAFVMTDALPVGLVYVPGSLEAGHGVAVYDGAVQRILWTGEAPGLHQTYLRFAARVEVYGTVTNTAQIGDNAGHGFERSAAVSVLERPRLPCTVYLPIIRSD